MKLAKLFTGLFILTLVGGFIFLAVTDIPVEQTQIKKTISNERFYGTD